MSILFRRCALLFCMWLGLAQAALADPVTDFFRAVQMDDPTYLKKLLKEVGPNTVDPISGETGLILAMREGSLRIFALLMEQPGIDLELTAPNGNTALMMAAYKQHKLAVQQLLARGAQVNRPGWTALHFAAASGDNDIIALLLAHHAQLDARSPTLLTPLMIAAREGQDRSVPVLLAAGADATLVNGEGLTAAQIAERADKPLIVAAIAAHLGARAKP